MGIGVSLLLIAAGAILAWAVHATTNGFDVNTVGYILLVVGVIGLLLSLMFWSTWAGPGYFTSRRRRTVTEGAAPAAGRRTVVEEDSTY
jgi:hypothetical protein